MVYRCMYLRCEGWRKKEPQTGGNYRAGCEGREGGRGGTEREKRESRSSSRQPCYWIEIIVKQTLCLQLDFAMVALGFQKTLVDTKVGRRNKGGNSAINLIIDDGTVIPSTEAVF